MLGEGKNPNSVIRFFLRRFIFLSFISSRVFFFPTLGSMADVGGSHLNIGAPVEKRGRGRPHGSKNKDTIAAAVALSSTPVKRRPGRPAGGKNKPKVPSVVPGPSAPSPIISPPPPRVYSFFCIIGMQCREIQRLSLKFTKFMDGRELREVVLREHSGGGTPYEVEVWYDGASEQYFKGG
jgi:hypothetical protein